MAVDYFGDRDQHPLVTSRALRRDLGLPLSATGLGAAAELFEVGAVAYGADLENHPDVLRRLGERRELLGNDAATIGAVRDWRVVRSFCREADVPYPKTLLPGEESSADGAVRWLRKRVRGGGGHGVRRWDGRALDAAHFLQEEVRGTAASATFVADGRRACLLALTEQLIGRRGLGSSGFHWCGNVLPLELPVKSRDRLTTIVEKMVADLSARFGLRGINGIDLIVADPAHDPRPFLLEVNPRFCASLELAEQAHGINTFALHLDALAGRLPASSPARRPLSDCVGKGIVFARRPARVPDTDPWLERGLRDVPHGGETIDAGHPVCTVVTRAADRDSCLRALDRGAATVQAELLVVNESARTRRPVA